MLCQYIFQHLFGHVELTGLTQSKRMKESDLNVFIVYAIGLNKLKQGSRILLFEEQLFCRSNPV